MRQLKRLSPLFCALALLALQHSAIAQSVRSALEGTGSVERTCVSETYAAVQRQFAGLPANFRTSSALEKSESLRKVHDALAQVSVTGCPAAYKKQWAVFLGAAEEAIAGAARSPGESAAEMFTGYKNQAKKSQSNKLMATWASEAIALERAALQFLASAK